MVAAPYWQSDDGRHAVYHGDCLAILPSLGPVDAVVTDPPYGLGDRWNGGAGGEKSSWRIPSRETKSWDMQTSKGVEELLRFGECIIWGGNYYNLPPTRCWLLWDKKQNDAWTTAQAEMAWTNLDRTVRTFRMAQGEAYGRMDKQHPAQKPYALMEWCLRWIMGQTILDPFMGSGTTGVACIRTGRRFIGIEISEDYCKIAVERMERELRQPMLFPVDAPRPEQMEVSE